MAKSTKQAKGKTEPKEEGKRAKAKREKDEAAEKARQAKIESGDLIVTKTGDFEKSSKDTKSLKRGENILKALQGAKEPVLVKDLAEKLGAYYEEVLPALTMLEAQGLATRFEVSLGGRGRRQVAYALNENL